MNRVLVNILVPLMEKSYDVWIPINKTVGTVIKGVLAGINSLSSAEYSKDRMPNFINRETGEHYDLNAYIIDTDIKNGCELIML